MSPEPGQDIAHYHVLSKIGEGGMGEVWRATDRRLGRQVALKLLPAEVADEPERLARFQREAQVLASLNHPNVAAIYGLEQVEGVSFLVLELIEGQDLAERLAQGPLPLDEALDVARQVAEGLEAAHERGIVHRDLKPANVKRTPDGTVKILDFGLAKAFQPAGSGEVDSSRSPTITSLSTQAGVILGTAAYMSPEQARGQEVDRRTDVWAFGCVLLEMLTGGNPFRGATVSDTLASILRSEPDLATLPPDTPAAVRRLLARCLDKDVRRRLRDIGEARIALEDVRRGVVDEPTAAAAPADGGEARRRPVVAVVAAVAVTALVALAVAYTLRPAAPAPHPLTFEVLAGGFIPTSPRVSPDGRAVAFVQEDRVWVRHLDRLEPVRLEGTEGATHLAWSPDSRTLYFATHGNLLSVPVTGGAPSTVAFGIGELSSVGGLDVHGDRIVFASGEVGVREVSLRGGEPRDLIVPDGKEEGDLHQPTFLPDGSVMFVVHRMALGADTIAVRRGDRTHVVLSTGGQLVYGVVYSPTGHLIYRQIGVRAGLWALPFSLEDLVPTGEPFLITTNGVAPSVAGDGTLLYVRNAGEGGVRSQLAWIARDGTPGESVGPVLDGIMAPEISPDETRVVFMRPQTEQAGIWMFDLVGGARSRLTPGDKPDWDPVWMPDGRRVLFWEGASRALAVIPADGSGEAERVVSTEILDCGNPAVSPDGRYVAFWARTGPLGQDVLLLELGGDGVPVPLLASPAVETMPQISPDGRYMAYSSNESGRSEVYLTRFPSGEGRWQISAQGGSIPRWASRGDELFYLDGTVMHAVPVTLGDVPRIGEPVRLFDTVDVHALSGANNRYDVADDGSRFLMVMDRQNEDVPPGIVIAFDWLAGIGPR